MQQLLFEKERQATQSIHRLQQLIPLARVQAAQQQTNYLNERLIKQSRQLIEEKQQQMQQAIQSLDLLSPLKIMGRGYSYTTKDETVVKSVAGLRPKDELLIHYQDGQAKVQVIELKDSKK